MKPDFLTSPEAWTRSSRGVSDPVGYAYAGTRQADRWTVLGTLVRAVVCVACCILIAYFAAGRSL